MLDDCKHTRTLPHSEECMVLCGVVLHCKHTLLHSTLAFLLCSILSFFIHSSSHPHTQQHPRMCLITPHVDVRCGVLRLVCPTLPPLLLPLTPPPLKHTRASLCTATVCSDTYEPCMPCCHCFILFGCTNTCLLTCLLACCFISPFSKHACAGVVLVLMNRI